MQTHETLENKITELEPWLREVQQVALLVYGKYDLDRSLLWLVEEVGELTAALRKGRSREEVFSELADVFAWVLCLSNILDLDLGRVASQAVSKETARQMRVYGKLKYASSED